MKKTLQRSIRAMLLLILFAPSASRAQDYCPIKIYNNDQTIGLSVTDPIYNDFVNGNYFLTAISADYYDCLNYTDIFIPVAKTANLSGVIAGADAIKGITFTLPTIMSCMGPNPVNTLQVGAISIVLRKSNGTEFLKVNFTDGVADECPYIAFPVTFGPFTLTPLTSPTRNRLNWTTYTESQMGHFTIEKSIDGANFYKIGEVAATNSPSGSSYQFIDNSVTNKNFYRVVSVDLNCYKQRTNIVWINCSTCPTTFTPPSLTPDCNLPTPTPTISGPASICDTSGKVFRLNDLKGEAQVTWSIAPSNLATLSPVGRIVTVKRTTNSGTGTLTATVVKSGITTTYSKTIALGAPSLSVYNTSSPLIPCTNIYQFTGHVNMLPNTTPSQYRWYQGSIYYGTGSSKTWTLTQWESFSYEVRYTGPCGESIGYGGNAEGRVGVAKPPRYAISTKPGQQGINISTIDPPFDPPFDPPLDPPCPERIAMRSRAAEGRMLDIKVFDMYGNLRKTAKVQSFGAPFTVNAGNLPMGIYYVHIAEKGKETVKQKVWIGK